jgi:LPLT family lysophospholipid transporter-like MFS transporter
MCIPCSPTLSSVSAPQPYSPAKYGILTEYLPHRLLVVANGWIEGLTVGAIILGVVVGGMLIRPDVATSVC